MKNLPEITLYGTETCHKTQYYKAFFENKELSYQFLDVQQAEAHAEALRNLYENRKLNFPTITIGSKKLRNPNEAELNKWLQKLSE